MSVLAHANNNNLNTLGVGCLLPACCCSCKEDIKLVTQMCVCVCIFSEFIFLGLTPSLSANHLPCVLFIIDKQSSQQIL